MSSPVRRQSDPAPEDPAESTATYRQPVDPQDLAVDPLEAEVLRAMNEDWRDGACRAAEAWLERHPQLRTQPEIAVRIIYEEVCLREERGEHVPSTEIYRRFPQWKDALEVVLGCHRLLQPETATAVLIEAGQRLGELQLLQKLGSGAGGHVFLATQPSLSDRLLVVKLIPRSGDEHLSLARLQHTHIAPLYLVQDFPAENLRALCMPYLGGTSWSALLQAMKPTPPQQRSGKQIVDLLERARQGAPLGANTTGPALRFLSRATYVQSIVWIGSCLADALHYAHQCGLVHLDIKPSNVLLAGDGQPMLLDFHLARPIVPAGVGPVDRLGGTRAYMSPEQELAARAVREGQPTPLALDGRSDIYSLGVLMYESLTGQLPPTNGFASRRHLRQRIPQASRGLEDVLHKCLAQTPANRYADAGQLAADLRRDLADLPLHGVPNRMGERWRKWRRRKPHALILVVTVVAALVATAAIALAFHGDRLQQARTALAQARRDFDNREYATASEQLETASAAIGWFPGAYDLKQELKTQLALTNRARLADAVHELVERLRFLDSFESMPVEKLRRLEVGCSKVWFARSKLAQSDTAPSSPAIEVMLRNDLPDLAVSWTSLIMRLAPADQTEQARRKALEVLDEAQTLCGPSPVLELARLECSANSESEKALAAASIITAPRTAWEHHVLGRFLFRCGKLEQAASEFRQAVALEPNAFWPNFYLTLCAYRQEHFDEAVNAASVCVALGPKRPECFYNRALCYQALGNAERALSDFSRALELDPTLGLAALHRGMLWSQRHHYPEAIADFETALREGADPAAAHYQLALVYVEQHDRSAALDSVRQALQYNADYAPAVNLKRKLDSGR